MTDDLLKRGRALARAEHSDLSVAGELCDRIEELEGLLKASDTAFERQNKLWDQAVKERNEAQERLSGMDALLGRIEELEAQLEKRDDLLDRWLRAFETEGHDPLQFVYEATIRAAQEGGDD